jgi:cell volume regulation protein A
MATWIFARLPPSIGAFAPVASLAAAALSYGIADVAGGSGFLAAYLVGLAIGSTPSRNRRQIVAFHEGLAFVAQVALFVVLGLLVFPSRLGAVAGRGLILALILVIVVRPVAVWLSTAFNAFSVRERILLGWAGLRGAAPIVLATFVLSARIDRAGTIFDAVFFVVIVSTLLQGTTLERLAKRLKLIDARPVRGVPPIEVDHRGQLDLIEFDVASEHAIVGAAVSELGLPRGALIAVIARDHDSIPPRGGSRLAVGDRLYLIAPHGLRPELEDVFSRWRRRV